MEPRTEKPKADRIERLLYVCALFGVLTGVYQWADRQLPYLITSVFLWLRASSASHERECGSDHLIWKRLAG